MRKMHVRGWMCLMALFLGTSQKVQAQSWSFTGNMGTQRAFFTVTVLNNGEVLVAGGRDRGLYGISSAELYNPSTGTFGFTGNLNTGRANFTATLLDNGKVLIAGGDAYIFMPTGTQHVCYSSAELYDPSTGKWTSTGSLNAGRYNHTATRLNNGEVLIAGGGARLASTELYNPATGKFSLAANLNTGRTDHSAVLLGNGDAMVVGGYDGSGGNIGYLSSAELFH
jgi:hypothetical protein